MFRILVSALLLILNLEAFSASVPPVTPTCITISTSGSVQLSWVVPAIPVSQFVSYKIYRSPAASSSFTLIGTVSSIATTWYLDNGVNANTAGYKYYVVVETNDGSQQFSPNSDTLQTLRLNVLNGPLGATLLWNAIKSPSPFSSYPVYYIYQRKPSEPWMMIDTVSSTSAEVEVFSLCVSDSLYFKIELRDSTGCSSFSNVVGKVLRDQTYPALLSFDSVSVDTLTNEAIMGWQPNLSRDVRGYIIYKNIGGVSANNIDTVFGQNNTFYRDANPVNDPSASSQAYSIATFDSCYNTTPWRYYQKSIHLSAVVNPCAGGVELTWTLYRHWPSGTKYSIYATSDSVFTHIADISSNDTTYTHTGVTHGETYCYVIRAYSGDNTRSSLSNKTCVYINTPKPPDFNYLKQTSVISASEVEVEWYVDPAGDVRYFNVMRATEDGVYVLADTIHPGNTTELIYVDDSLETAKYVYKYYLVAVDTCGNPLLSSNIGTSLKLLVKANPDLKNHLKWNSYADYEGNGLTYELYRAVNGSFEVSPVATLSDTSLSFLDDVYDFSEMNGNFCYYLQAVEGEGNPHGLKGVSKSDVVCVTQLPRLYIPNAFTPNGDGHNDVFKPENVFVAVTEYNLVIYDRRGQKVFETNDPETGWDGYFKGDIVQTGVYPYYLFMRAGDSEPFHKGGTITVLP